MATFNIQLPNVRQLDWNDKKTQNMLLDFFNELVEKLNYTLNNMDLTNFDRTTYNDLSKFTDTANATDLITQIEQAEGEERISLFNRLRDLIIKKADEVTENYQALFKKDDEVLQSIYEMSVAAVSPEDGTYTAKWTSEIEQKANSINITVKNVEDIATANSESLEDLGTRTDALETVSNNIETWFTFTDHFEIGRADSPFSTVIDNTSLSFTQNGQPVAWITNNELVITNARINNDLSVLGDVSVAGDLSLGEYMFVIESNGSLSVKKRA